MTLFAVHSPVHQRDWLSLTLPALFEQQVELTPEALAVVFEERNVTYREMNARANAYATVLQDAGVCPEVVVGLYWHRGTNAIEQLVTFWAIQKAGGVLLSLDSSLPPARIRFLLQDTKAQVLIVHEQLHAGVAREYDETAGLRLKHLFGLEESAISLLSSPRLEELNPSAVNPLPTTHVENAAYIITTSGSTGMPKSVVVTHKGLGNLAEAQIGQFGVLPGERVLQFASWGFDASISEILMAHASGATLYPVSRKALAGGESLASFLKIQKVSVATLTPSVLTSLPATDFPVLQTLVSAGEPCSAALVQRWAEGRSMFNAYGPTESSVCATMERCVQNGLPPSLGTPLPYVEVSIRDEAHRILPYEESGEIVLCGIGLARGYTNSTLTEERFILDPDDQGKRLYLTGDRGRKERNGTLTFLGRVAEDTEVKLRGGIRADLREIEAALLSPSQYEHASLVEACCVLLIEKTLIAIVVPSAAYPFSIVNLRYHLEAQLPSYMVPNVFIPWKILPRTSNDKVDRGALQRELVSWRHLFIEGEQFAVAQNGTERQVAENFAEVYLRNIGVSLDVAAINLMKSFKENGGDSFAAEDFILTIGATFHIELTEDELELTLGQVADVIDSLQKRLPHSTHGDGNALTSVGAFIEEVVPGQNGEEAE